MSFADYIKSVGPARAVLTQRELTVYFGEFPAQITVYPSCMYGSGQPHISDRSSCTRINTSVSTSRLSSLPTVATWVCM